MNLDQINNKYDIILASKSPRRKQLLAEMGIQFKTEIREVEEVYPDSIEAENVAEYLAVLKSKAFDPKNNELIITSDTTVVVDDKVLGKPKDREEAIQMIQSLSKRTHFVISACALHTVGGIKSFANTTEVQFDDLSDEEIAYYVDKFQPYDKAGAYGIQEWIGHIGIKKINGCYYNVMGLPQNALYQELKKLV